MGANHIYEQEISRTKMLGSMGVFEELAPAVVFLCSDAVCRVTGASHDVTTGNGEKYPA